MTEITQKMNCLTAIRASANGLRFLSRVIVSRSQLMGRPIYVGVLISIIPHYFLVRQLPLDPKLNIRTVPLFHLRSLLKCCYNHIRIDRMSFDSYLNLAAENILDRGWMWNGCCSVICWTTCSISSLKSFVVIRPMSFDGIIRHNKLIHRSYRIDSNVIRFLPRADKQVY